MAAPITTAFLPSKSISACFKISIMPSGVQGTKVCSSIYSLPIFDGWKPSTSLSGLIASNIFVRLLVLEAALGQECH